MTRWHKKKNIKKGYYNRCLDCIKYNTCPRQGEKFSSLCPEYEKDETVIKIKFPNLRSKDQDIHVYRKKVPGKQNLKHEDEKDEKI